MKLPKFLSVVTFVTVLCLLHVYQQTEVFRFAYAGQKKFVILQDLLDKNVFLRYNIEKNTSLTRLGDRVYDAKDFEMPQTYRLVRMQQPALKTAAFNKPRKIQNLFARLFGVIREAEARTIKP